MKSTKLPIAKKDCRVTPINPLFDGPTSSLAKEKTFKCLFINSSVNSEIKTIAENPHESLNLNW